MHVFRLLALLLGVPLLCMPLPAQSARKSHHSARPAAALPAQVSTHGPGDAGASARDFSRWLDAVEQSGQVSGLAVAVVKNDKVLLQRGIGYADAQRSLPVTTDTTFRLASLSKAFASALAAILVEDGMLSWDTHVAGVLPSFELQNVSASEKLTVRDILSQRVGLPHNTYDGLLEQDQPYQVLIDKLKEVPLTCEVGDCYGYQNITFALIGDITYAVSGDFFYHQVEKRLFHPLGMQTATYGKDALESSASWARPHMRRGNAWVPFQIKESYYHVPPAAGVNASIKDMTQWLIAQMGNRPDVLSEKVLTTLHTPEIDTPTERHASPWRRSRLRDAHYALGWRIYDYAGETLVFHAGAVQGYRAVIGFFPKYQFGAVMLWNCECALPMGLMPMLLDRYLGLPGVDWAGIESTKRSAKLMASGDDR
ncbi:MAG TPA: serine hydrolase domain-containing protein [Rudaea sp.]|nr:serine hydrolase domain-containing protein [Rudaea sp.]